MRALAMEECQCRGSEGGSVEKRRMLSWVQSERWYQVCGWRKKERGCDLGHTSVCAAQFRFEQFQFGYFEELAPVVESVDASAILVTCEAWSR